MRRKNTTSDNMKEYMSNALLILMRNNQYKDISIGEITNKAGVHRSTYYRNFKSKEDIIRYYYHHILEEYRNSKNETIDLKSHLFRIFTHYYKYKKELLLLYKADLSYLMLDSLNETFRLTYKSNTKIDTYFVYYHTGGIYNNFILWFSSDMQESPQEITEIICSFLPKDTKPMLKHKE